MQEKHTLEASSSYRYVLDKVLKKKSNRLSYQFYKLPAKSCEGKKAFIWKIVSFKIVIEICSFLEYKKWFSMLYNVPTYYQSRLKRRLK